MLKESNYISSYMLFSERLAVVINMAQKLILSLVKVIIGYKQLPRGYFEMAFVYIIHFRI